MQFAHSADLVSVPPRPALPCFTTQQEIAMTTDLTKLTYSIYMPYMEL